MSYPYYPYHTTGIAFYSETSSGPSFHFMVYDLGWQATDGEYVGPGVKGVLFYNGGYFDGTNHKMSLDGVTNIDYYIEKQHWEGDKYKVNIKFYDPTSPDVIFAESFADDPFDRSGESGILNQRRTATWEKVDSITANSTVSKASGTMQTTLIVPPICKRAIMQFSQIRDEAFYVEGRFTSKNARAPGNFVTWYKDCAIFHNDRDAKDYISFLLVIDPPKALGPEDGIKSGVIWENM